MGRSLPTLDSDVFLETSDPSDWVGPRHSSDLSSMELSPPQSSPPLNSKGSLSSCLLGVFLDLSYCCKSGSNFPFLKSAVSGPNGPSFGLVPIMFPILHNLKTCLGSACLLTLTTNPPHSSPSQSAHLAKGTEGCRNSLWWAGGGSGDPLAPGPCLVSVAATNTHHSALPQLGAHLTHSPSCRPLGHTTLLKLSPRFLGAVLSPQLCMMGTPEQPILESPSWKDSSNNDFSSMTPHQHGWLVSGTLPARSTFSPTLHPQLSDLRHYSQNPCPVSSLPFSLSPRISCLSNAILTSASQWTALTQLSTGRLLK